MHVFCISVLLSHTDSSTSAEEKTVKLQQLPAPRLRRLSDSTEGTGHRAHRLLLVPKHIVKAAAPSMTILLICS